MHAEGNVLPISEFRLFSDIGELKYNERKIAKVIQQAERALTEPIPLLPASLYRDFFLTGNRAGFENEYFKRRNMASALAPAESYEKKGRFAKKLADVVWAILEESTRVIPAHTYVFPFGGGRTLLETYGDHALEGIDLFSAATGANLASVYYLAKDALDSITPIIAEKLKYTVSERITRPFLKRTFWWTGDSGNRVNNWNPWVISNVLLAVSLTEDSLYKRECVVEKAVCRLDNFFTWYAPDGGCDEGPVYWGATGASMFDCLELIEDMSGGKLSIYDCELVRNIGEYMFKENIDGERIVLGEGEMLIMNKHVFHSVKRADTGDIGVNIIMTDELISSLSPELSGTVFAPLIRENGRPNGAPIYLYLRTGGHKSIENLIENLLLELTSGTPEVRIMERTVVLLLSCLSRDSELLVGASELRTADSRRDMEIISYIKNNYRTATLEELCRRLYLTVPYLSRLIRERLGRSFKELVIEERMERAHELILNTGMPIGDIIRAVGYENESYFHRLFRARYGTTPLALRRATSRYTSEALRK